MNETAPQFDSLAQARFDAQPENHPKEVDRYDEWVGAPGRLDPESAKDLVAYLESRPYKDESGNVHDPLNGQFAGKNGDYFDKQRQAHSDESLGSSYEDMGMVELAHRLGQAEIDDDKTTQSNVLDVLLSKIDTHVASGIGSDSDREARSAHKVRNTHNKDDPAIDSHAVWLDRIINVKDAYKEEQTVQSGVEQPGQSASSASELDQNTKPESKPIEHIEATRARVLKNINESRKVREARSEISTVDLDEGVQELPGTRWGRVKQSFRRAKDKLSDLYIGASSRVANSATETAKSVSEYLNDDEKGNHRKKILGVAVGTLAIAGVGYMVYKGINNGGGSRNAHSINGDILTSATGGEHVDLQVTDNSLPWTHITERIGSNGTPKIMELVEKGQTHGWEFIGNGQGGGSGAILEVITPAGERFTDNGHINAALDLINSL